MTVSMLVGTTFAWFTDSVTSAGNKIVAGNLDVKLHMYDATQDKYVDISNSDKPIFGDGALASADTGATLWEPGKTQVVYLAIENAGSLSLQYKVALNVTDIEKDINLALSYKITPDAKAGDVTSWDGTNALGVVAGEQIVSNGAVPMKSGDMHYFALSVHMDELAGNEYMDGSISPSILPFLLLSSVITISLRTIPSATITTQAHSSPVTPRYLLSVTRISPSPQRATTPQP